MKQPSDIRILLRMLKELGALAAVMTLTILCGVGGYLAAAAIPVFIAVAALGFAGTNVGLSFRCRNFNYRFISRCAWVAAICGTAFRALHCV